MSSTPRPESNTSGGSRFAPKNSRKNSGNRKGKGYKSAGHNPGGKGGYRRDERQGRNTQKNNRNGASSRTQNRGTEKDREETRTIGGRAGYRPSKSKAPEIDNDVTGRELDGATQRQLRSLEQRNAETVAKHLVMAGRYLDIDPQFALEHALTASRSAGRIAAVREAVGVAAYVAEDYEVALRELRTHRRISGSGEHLALLVDCERALGRIPKALEMIAESTREDLTDSVRVELAIVASGIHADSGDAAQAVKALNIPQLNPKRAFAYSPRLFSAYAQALAGAGRAQEASKWERLAKVAEAALGQGEFAEPEIFDIYGEAELFEPLEEPAAETDTQTDVETDSEAETVVEADDAVNNETAAPAADGSVATSDTAKNKETGPVPTEPV